MKDYKKALEILLRSYTPEELAKKIGASRASVFNWKGGHNEPTGLARKAILQFFQQESLTAREKASTSPQF